MTDIEKEFGPVVANELLCMHTHAKTASKENPDQIVYREEDILNFLRKLRRPPRVGTRIGFKPDEG
jgi:hypothetical protein